ncbi:metal transporter [Shewanella avicenniae]|uniref:Metal transporter n=1 Tax=Shewanella avicenniae TaxID=2814294 RepID=A0ABX7QSB2_9GAMM|nr:metal transporter [Shewanella avicenniae]QSX33576.1 metal transporter [Shewanella avicenniae]
MTYLIASCIALLFGPVCYRFLSNGSGLHKGLDGFIFVSLGGLVLIHILPELLEHGGILAIAFVVLGLWGPTASEKLFHRYSDLTHKLTLIFGISGLLLHTITDGGALVLAQQGQGTALLALGVILHRLPVGLAIWYLLTPQAGRRWAIVVLGLMILLTTFGYVAGEQLLNHLSLDNTVYLQAFVTGSILHVVMHQPHADTPLDSTSRYELHAGIGSLLGIGLLALLLFTENDAAGHHHHEHNDLFDWLLSLAPALLLMFVLAACRRVIGFSKSRQTGWLRQMLRQAAPEMWIFAILLLGPAYGMILLLFSMINAWLISFNQPQSGDVAASSANLMSDVERCAPWILLSLLLANLIGHPSLPLSADWAQVLLLIAIFSLLPFSVPGAIVLAMGLGSSEWSAPAVVFCLLAPLIRGQISMKVAYWKIATASALSLAALVIVHFWQPPTVQVLHYPQPVEFAALIATALLFAIGLLRLGPRKFLGRLKPNMPALAGHHHQHAHSSHQHEHSHHHQHSEHHH